MANSERAIFELSTDVLMAIRLRAVKSGLNNGQIIEQAIREVFPRDVQEAQAALQATSTSRSK